MDIMVHDYCGHPFQIHLSRQLAARGHRVLHAYYADNHGPKGLFRRPDDPASLEVIGMSLDCVVAQTALLARRSHDRAYGKRVADLIRIRRPDVVISGNTPTEAQQFIIKGCKDEGSSFVYWLQDIYSIAVTKLLKKQIGRAGAAIGGYYRWLDRSQFRRSDAIIAITDDFSPLAGAWSGDPAKVSVIENWAALEDCPVGPKDNAWARTHGLNERFTFLYSGTLGRKHNPMLLLQLAKQLDLSAMVAVVAQGVGMQLLQNAPPLAALKLLPLQPAARFPEVLATGDVLIASIESDAGSFAVPSKVQSYLCAGRPILLAAPKENLAARTVLRANAGLVVDPDDTAGFLAAAERLLLDPALRADLGANGRAYAERTFDLRSITDRFEAVFRAIRPSRTMRRQTAISKADPRLVRPASVAE
ncbi:glycosyltransferase family 4 protein [Rhodopila sp.]|uniref:glycosyltransferase family 4 protein n=1 Tax=Rhodopila sp. TaxID=2480087 RepID=UPI003D0E9EC8